MAPWTCPQCGEDRPAAMERNRGLCGDCAARTDGRPDKERHHILGRANSDLDSCMPINWHRVLHARQAHRPETLKDQVDRHPLHRIALIATTVSEAVDAFADYARRHGWPQWIAEFAVKIAALCDDAAQYLLVLAAWLDNKLGSDWIGKAPQWPTR
jgi:hypothetical protein